MKKDIVEKAFKECELEDYCLLFVLDYLKSRGGYSSSSGSLTIRCKNTTVNFYDDYMIIDNLSYYETKDKWSEPTLHSKFTTGVENGNVETLILPYDQIKMLGIIKNFPLRYS